MLKTLALVLLVTAAACRPDDAPAPAAPGAAGGEGRTGGAAGGPAPRSGKIEPGPRPALPSGDDDGKAAEGAGGSGMAGAAGDTEERRVRRRERMMSLDTDGDGVISDEEREAARQQREADMIARLDTDGDGKVSDAERAAARRDRAGETHARLDKNGDGKVTADELTGRGTRGLQMQDADANGDGDLSVDEISEAMRARRAARNEWLQRRRAAGSGDAPPADGAEPPAAP